MDPDSVPPAVHEVAIYTDLLEVKGEISAWPPRRVLDVLNTKDMPLLTVERASVISLSQWGKAQPTSVESIVLNKNEIVVVWPIRETAVQTSDFVTIHKVPAKVAVYAGPFIIHGLIHVIREATLSQALDSIKEDFIALTEPSVFCLSSPQLSLRAGSFAAVNADRTVAVHSRS